MPVNMPLKRRYHEAAAENGYVVTVQQSRKICDVTNGDVQIRSEMAKHCPPTHRSQANDGVLLVGNGFVIPSL